MHPHSWGAHRAWERRDIHFLIEYVDIEVIGNGYDDEQLTLSLTLHAI